MGAGGPPEGAGPGGVYPPPGPERRSLAGRLHAESQSILVGARHVGDAFAEGPGRHLEMQRQDAIVLYDHLTRLLQQRLTLVVVNRGQGLVDQRVHLRVGVAPAVGAAIALYLVRDRKSTRLNSSH